MPLQYIVVSGEPRSGTSLMMQTLSLLGLDTWVDDHMLDRLGDIVPKEFLYDLNPKGFYETKFVSTGLNLPSIMTFVDKLPTTNENKQKFKDHLQTVFDRNNGKVVKVVTNGLLKTDPDYIKHLIMCMRNPVNVAASQTNLISNVQIPEKEGWKNLPSEFTPSRYIFEMASLCVYFLNNPTLLSRTTWVDYETIVECPEQEITRLCQALGVNNGIEKAVQNVDKKLRRQNVTLEDMTDDWKLAMKIYEALRNQNITADSLKPIIEETENYAKTQMDKHERWLDEGTWVFCDISFYQKLQNNPELKKILQINAQELHKNGLTCISCPHYNRDGEKYTIVRKDIRLEKSKINCQKLGKQITVEVCQNHWEHYRREKNGT